MEGVGPNGLKGRSSVSQVSCTLCLTVFTPSDSSILLCEGGSVPLAAPSGVCALFPARQARWEQLLLHGCIKRPTRLHRASCHWAQDPGGVPKRAPGPLPRVWRSPVGPPLPDAPGGSGLGGATPRPARSQSSPARSGCLEPRPGTERGAGSRPAATVQVSWASSAGRPRAEPAEQGLGGARGCGEHCETPRGARGLCESRGSAAAHIWMVWGAASERAPQGAARVSPVTPGLEAKAEAGARLYRQVRASSRPFLCGASVRPAGAAVSAAWSLTLLLNH